MICFTKGTFIDLVHRRQNHKYRRQRNVHVDQGYEEYENNGVGHDLYDYESSYEGIEYDLLEGHAINGQPCLSLENVTDVDELHLPCVPREGESGLWCVADASNSWAECSSCYELIDEYEGVSQQGQENDVALYANKAVEIATENDDSSQLNILNGKIDAREASLGTMFTVNGCECEPIWKVYGHAPCVDSCCSPDGDDNHWCVVKDATCEPTGQGWGYCDGSLAPNRTFFKEEVRWFEPNERIPVQPGGGPTENGSQQLPASEGNVVAAASLSIVAVAGLGFLLYVLRRKRAQGKTLPTTV